MIDRDLEAKVIDVVTQVLNVPPTKIMTLDANFMHDFGADSLDSVELMMAFEAAFNNISISDEDAIQIVTVRDAVNYLKDKTT